MDKIVCMCFGLVSVLLLYSVYIGDGHGTEVERFFSSCDLARMVQEVIGNYIMAEEFFMKEMIIKVWPTSFVV